MLPLAIFVVIASLMLLTVIQSLAGRVPPWLATMRVAVIFLGSHLAVAAVGGYELMEKAASYWRPLFDLLGEVPLWWYGVGLFVLFVLEAAIGSDDED